MKVVKTAASRGKTQ